MVAQSLVGIAAIFVRFDPRGDLDCLGEICDRLIVVARGLIAGAPVNVSDTVARVDLNRARIVRYRSFMIALGLIGDAAVQKSIGLLRIDVDRVAVIRDSAIDVIFCPVAKPRFKYAPASCGLIWMTLVKSAIARSLSPLVS